MLAVAAMAMEKLNTENSSAIRRGSIQGHSVIFRNQVEGHEKLYRDYFAKSPTYPPNLFRRRFRMNRSLFVRILSNMEVYDPYFVHKLIRNQRSLHSNKNTQIKKNKTIYSVMISI